jgi:hypothetical protein
MMLLIVSFWTLWSAQLATVVTSSTFRDVLYR